MSQVSTLELPYQDAYELLFAHTNREKNDFPPVEFTLTWEWSVNSQSGTSSTDQTEQTHAWNVEIAGEYGFSDLASVSFEAGYEGSTTHTRETTSSTLEQTTIDTTRSIKISTNPIPPGESLYLYRVVHPMDRVTLKSVHTISSSEPISPVPGTVTLEGKKMPLVDHPNVPFAITSVYPDGRISKSELARKTLAVYGAERPYMGDGWVLGEDSNHSAEWYFDPAEDFLPERVYWIRSRETGKLLSWFEGGSGVYAGDTWVKDESKPVPPGFLRENARFSSLWRVFPDPFNKGLYFVAHYKTDKLLSWYRDKFPYVGGNQVIGEPKNYSSRFRLIEQG